MKVNQNGCTASFIRTDCVPVFFFFKGFHHRSFPVDFGIETDRIMFFKIFPTSFGNVFLLTALIL